MLLHRDRRQLRLFFASDLHASERCFRKFVAAARFYQADLLLLGGDLAGKRLVLLGRRAVGGYEVWEGRETRVLATAAEASEYERALADTGAYTARVDDRAALTELDRVTLMDQAAQARLESWVDYADKRLCGTGVRVVVIPGNDDPFSFDELLRDTDVWLNADGRVVRVSPGLQVAGLGCSTPTPWHTPRELPDEEIDAQLARILGSVDPALPLVLDVHVPPYGSGLDTCPVLDENLRPVLGVGGPLTAPVGSRAVRRHIADRQPLMGLHGHVHEGRGCTKIGRTLCANPGSQYAEGRLLGFLAVVSGDCVKNWILTEG
jgi:Icc-related predicted phosphoesterase